jgi:hypothetical protein
MPLEQAAIGPNNTYLRRSHQPDVTPPHPTRLDRNGGEVN